MSIVKPATLICAHCGHEQEVPYIHSINGDRKSELRDRILDNTIGQVTCEGCGVTLRSPPELTYWDQTNRLWLNVRPPQDENDWMTHEAETANVHAVTFGITAPPFVQELAEGMTKRLVFGWAGLREKLICQLEGIDDVTLELAKLAVMREGEGLSLPQGAALRLASASDTELTFVWLVGLVESCEGVLDVPRALLHEIEATPEAWRSLRADLEQGFFVDVLRLFTAPEDEAAA